MYSKKGKHNNYIIRFVTLQFHNVIYVHVSLIIVHCY